MSELTPVRKRFEETRGLLERLKPQLALALPKHLTPERLVRVTLTEVVKTPKLLDCDPRTFAGAVLQAAQLGLEPGVLGLAYFVPYGRTVTLIPGYKGLIQLARRSGQIKTVEVRVVHAKDRFKVAFGTAASVVHDPYDKADDPGELVAVYAVAHLKDGGLQFDFMWKREIDRIRTRSKAGHDGPWVTDYEEMAKKTVLRRLCKLLPVSIELQTAVALDEAAQAGIPQDLGALVDIESIGQENGTPVIEVKPEPSKLDALAERLASETKEGAVIFVNDPPVAEASGARPEPTSPSAAAPASTSSGAASSAPAERRGPGRPRKDTAAAAPAPSAPPAAEATVRPAPAPAFDALRTSEITLERTRERLTAATSTAEVDAIEEGVYAPEVWRRVLPAHKIEINRAFQVARERVGG